MVTLEQEIKNVEKDIETELHGYDEMVLLASLPGLGLIGCASILAYLGEVDDFETADQAVSFVGLAPRVFNSGKQQHTGTISKHGNSLIRKTLIQSIWVMVRYRYGGAILNHYENVRKRRGKGRAVVAAARKMMVVIYSMLKNGELYRDYEERLYQNKLKQFHLV
jgi:transposase